MRKSESEKKHKKIQNGNHRITFVCFLLQTTELNYKHLYLTERKSERANENTANIPFICCFVSSKLIWFTTTVVKKRASESERVNLYNLNLCSDWNARTERWEERKRVRLSSRRRIKEILILACKVTIKKKKKLVIDNENLMVI